MGKFMNRVGQVSLRVRAIEASRYTLSVVGGLKTTDIANHQGITPRQALKVMRYAEKQGWLHSVKAPHRNNSFYHRWIVFTRDHFELFDNVSVAEKETAEALISAYFWGKIA